MAARRVLAACSRCQPVLAGRGLGASTRAAKQPSASINVVRFSSTGSSSSQTYSSARRFRWVPIPVSVGIAFIGYQHFRRRQSELHGDDDTSSSLTTFLRLLPLRALSRLWGRMNEVELPEFARKPVLGAYAWMFGCKVEEAQVEDLTQYRNLQEFFGRQLKNGVRPVDSQAVLVAPADSRVLTAGPVEGYMAEQIKGVRYNVETFIGEAPSKPKPGHRLFHIVFYLAPGDYHHFHSPADVEWNVQRHFPGDLLSVSPFIVKRVRGLFNFNERVVLSGTWQFGTFHFGAIGATNVGSIWLDTDKSLATNQSEVQPGPIIRASLDKEQFSRGEHVGSFRLGSSIALVFEAPENFEFVVKPQQKVCYGQAVGVLNGSKTQAA